jgi:hypothetical protein
VTDLVYGPAVHERGDGFTAAQSICNLVENAINLSYVALWRKGSPLAPLVGLVGATATAWKTVSPSTRACLYCLCCFADALWCRSQILYWLMDYLTTANGKPWGMTGHNTRFNWWLLFALPNGLWIVIPSLIVYIFAREIAAKLRQTTKPKSE